MSRLAGKKVLITGASGFIGSHLLAAAVREGARVAALVRCNSIERNVRIAHLWDEIEIFEADIRNLGSLSFMPGQRFDIIFHLAAYNHVGNSFQHAGEAMETNAMGTMNLLESAGDYARFVYISTSEVYGLQEPEPFVEHLYPRPLSPYSVGKFAGEQYALLKHRQAGRPIAVLRPFNAFGPYQSTRAVIPEIVVRCLRGIPVYTTDGRQTREFNFVADLAEGMILAALNDRAIGQVLNLGNGRDLAIREVVRMIHQRSGSTSELQIGAVPTRPNEIWTMRSDASRARELLGWNPSIGFEDGLDLTIAWFRRYIDIYHGQGSPLLALGPGR